MEIDKVKGERERGTKESGIEVRVRTQGRRERLIRKPDQVDPGPPALGSLRCGSSCRG